MRARRKRVVGIAVPHEKPVETRIDLLEHEVHAQGKILTDVVSALGEIKDILAKQPAVASTKERLGLIGTTAGIVIAFMTLANGWLDSRLAPDRQTISTISRHTENYPVLAYRLSEVEKRMETIAPFGRTTPTP